MSTPVWAKTESAATDDAMMRFMAGEDVVLDRELIAYDITASVAPVRALARAGLLPTRDAAAIQTAPVALRRRLPRVPFPPGTPRDARPSAATALRAHAPARRASMTSRSLTILGWLCNAT